MQFLQWALPRMHMRWPGFRRVHKQVCKRLDQRLTQLKLADVNAYRHYLDAHREEWTVLDGLSRVTISRFYREKAVFHFLEQQVLPELVQQVIERGDKTLKVWSIGSASGEEPYTIAIIWELQISNHYPDTELSILATDADPILIQRSQQACYPYSSIKNLPETWPKIAFDELENNYCLKPEFRRYVRYLQQDIRDAITNEHFDLVLCRNLVFTYFDEALQHKLLGKIARVLQPNGALVLGIHEYLPDDDNVFATWSEKLRVYRKQSI
ncbi:CheR family methyltransferase [Kaarinaea lacus]